MNKIFDYKNLLLNGCNSLTISSYYNDLVRFEHIYKYLYKNDVYSLDDYNINDIGYLLEMVKRNISGKKFIIFKTKFDDLNFYKYLKNISLNHSNVIIICLIEIEYKYMVQLSNLYISRNDISKTYDINKDRCSYLKNKCIEISEIDIMERNLKIDMLCQ